MKAAFIVVSAGEPMSLINKLKRQVKELKLRSYNFYHIKNERMKEGFSQGVNKGIRKGLRSGADLFIVMNPDISLLKITKKSLLEGIHHFAIWGFAMKQQNKIYYGGEIDKWRMSGGLIAKRPKKRFAQRDFVSGSLICLKKEVFDSIGWWNEDYFLYYEDIDYCYRAALAGFRVGIDSQTLYEHFELSAKNNPLKNKYLRRGRLRFFVKFSNAKQKVRELIRVPKTILERKKNL